MQSVQQGKLYKLAGKGEFAKAVGVRLTRGMSGFLILASLACIGGFFTVNISMFRNPFVLIALVIIGAFAPYIITMVYLTLTRQGFAVVDGDNVTINNRLTSVTVPIGSSEFQVRNSVYVSGVEMFKVVLVRAGGTAFTFYTDDLQYFEMLTRKDAMRPDDKAELVKARRFQRRKQKYGSAKETTAEGDKYVLPYRHNRRGTRAVFIMCLLIWCALASIVILAITQDPIMPDFKEAVFVILILLLFFFIIALPAIAAWRSGRKKYPEYILLDRKQSLISTDRRSFEPEKITNADFYIDKKHRAVLRFMYDFKKVKLILGSTEEGMWYSFNEHEEFADEIGQIIKTDVRERI